MAKRLGKLTYRATHRLHGVLARKVLAEAEVNHLDASRVILVFEHEVFWFDISAKMSTKITYRCDMFWPCR